MDSIEDFWKYVLPYLPISSAYNYIPPLYDLVPNTDYMLFKAEVRPEWEAPTNRDGGKWVLTFATEDLEAMNIQDIWEQLLLALIGCTFSHYEYINGMVVSVRERHVRLSLWTSMAEDKEVIREIGKHFREVAKLSPKYQVVYQLHASAINQQLDNNFISAL